MNPQRILLEKNYVNTAGVFLPEEIDALKLVAENLCMTWPDITNPFVFGIGTRRLTSSGAEPQLELVLSHVRLSSPPYNQPDFYQDECRRMLRIATQPMDYFAGLKNAQDFCEPNENALRNGVIVQSDRMILGSIKDENGWFVLGIKFEHLQSLNDNTFAVAFLAGITETIFAMDEHNERLRAADLAFQAACQNWQIELPQRQLRAWLGDSGFSAFVYNHYKHSGPRRFFG